MHKRTETFLEKATLHRLWLFQNQTRWKVKAFSFYRRSNLLSARPHKPKHFPGSSHEPVPPLETLKNFSRQLPRAIRAAAFSDWRWKPQHSLSGVQGRRLPALKSLNPPRSSHEPLGPRHSLFTGVETHYLNHCFWRMSWKRLVLDVLGTLRKGINELRNHSQVITIWMGRIRTIPKSPHGRFSFGFTTLFWVNQLIYSSLVKIWWWLRDGLWHCFTMFYPHWMTIYSWFTSHNFPNTSQYNFGDFHSKILLHQITWRSKKTKTNRFDCWCCLLLTHITPIKQTSKSKSLGFY